MTYRDVLNRLLSGFYPQDMETTEYVGKLEEACEKQIEKKIKHSQWIGINGNYYDLCPNCETNLCTDGAFGRDKKHMKYCESCGQKLDWT